MAAQRITADFYPTPQRVTDALLDNATFIEKNASVLEPCAGDGAIATRLTSLGFDVLSTDLRDHLPFSPRDSLDTTSLEYWTNARTVDWVITNPPFSVMSTIVPLAIEHASTGVAFLLRLTSQEPTKNRAGWLQRYADHLRMVIAFGQPRPRFRSDIKGTDSVTTAWYVWDKRWSWKHHGITCPFVYDVRG